MTAKNFPPSLKIILREEGGNDDDPRDRGGRTSRGIIQSEWDAYRRNKPKLPADVWQAPQADIETIYKTQYWNPYCDQLPSGIDLVFFNASVNSGRQQAVKEMQRALGVAPDGMMGIETLAAVGRVQDYKALVRKICDQRRNFYRHLKQFNIYGKGWMARTDRVEVAALDMAPAPTMPDTRDYVAAVTGDEINMSAKKADPMDVSQAAIDARTASTGTAISSGGAAITDQLQDVAGQLSPYAETIKWVKIALLVIAVICAGFAIWAIIKRNRNEAVT